MMMLTGRVSLVVLFVPAVVLGQVAGKGVGKEPGKVMGKPVKDPVTTMLQPNSLLSGVLIPRYDAQRRLLGVFRAGEVKLVTQEVLDGMAITVDLYEVDRSPKGRVELERARYDQSAGSLRGLGRTRMVMGEMVTVGSGLVFHVDRSEGYLNGPVNTRFKYKKKGDPMSFRSRSMGAAAAVGVTMMATGAAGGEEVVAAGTDAGAGARKEMEVAGEETRAHLREALEASAEATRKAVAYLESESLLAKEGGAGRKPAPAPVAEFTPGPEDAVIDCDGGMYFNSEEGVLVYLDNVTVEDPRLKMKGADEIKVFFSRKEDNKGATKEGEGGADPKEGEAGKDGKDDKPEAVADLGKLKRIVATGRILFEGKPDPKKRDEPPVMAYGAVFTYNVETGEIILSGDKPWVRQGGLINRAKRADQTIRIVDGVATFSAGGTQTIIPRADFDRNLNR